MKKTWLLFALAATVFLGSCKSSGSDKEIATDMCGCFNMLKASMPPEALQVFDKAAVSPTPKETFTEEVQKLDPETGKKITEALMSTAQTGTPISDCLNKLDKKYKTTEKDQQVMTQRMVDGLKDSKDCNIMLALMRMNLKK